MAFSIAHPSKADRDTWREVVFDHMRIRYFGMTAEPTRALRDMLNDAVLEHRWLDALTIAQTLDWLEGNTAQETQEEARPTKRHDDTGTDTGIDLRERMRARRMSHLTGAQPD